MLSTGLLLARCSCSLFVFRASRVMNDLLHLVYCRPLISTIRTSSAIFQARHENFYSMRVGNRGGTDAVDSIARV